MFADKLTKRAAIYLSLFVAAGFLILNFPYFGAQFRYLLFGAATAPELDSVTPIVKAECLSPNQLKIASLGIEAPIIYVDESTEERFQTALKDGVVHFPGTALPGEDGNVYIFGHSSDYTWSQGEYKNIFALLPKIKPGDSILISDALGQLFTYSVTGTLVVSPKETGVLDQQAGKVRMLTLQTSYPLGTALRRFIVQAKLESEEPSCAVLLRP